MTRYFTSFSIAVLIALTCHGENMPHTGRTKGLIQELLIKLDSTDIYAAKREEVINAKKSKLPGKDEYERYRLYFDLAVEYSNFISDSSLVYLDKAKEIAQAAGNDSLKLRADIFRSRILSTAGFYAEAMEIIESVPRNSLKGDIFVDYYHAWSVLYHNLYSGPNGPEDFKKKYREKYNVYRDSLLMVADTLSLVYLSNIEKKEARAGNFKEARRYNALRSSIIKDPRSKAKATCIYDRFAIAYNYERHLTGEAVDDVLESAILEVENSNQDIASLLRVESLLLNINEVKAAKKVSDYYSSTLRKFGSRKRIVEGMEQMVKINDRNLQALKNRNNQVQLALVVISLLFISLIFALVKINGNRLKIMTLNSKLKKSDEISKSYIGVVFQFYSSYINRLDLFRTKIYSNLKKGNVEQVMSLASPSNNVASEDMKELYRNFDSAFINIFPDFIGIVNGCMKPEFQIVPKKTEILTTELRILALIKLGIKDSTKIAEMLHCSVKTVYNLRSEMKSHLAVPFDEFKVKIQLL